MDKKIKIEANGDFPFTFFIEKAIPGGTDEQMTIKGVASTVNVDHDNERMSKESLHAMADIINEKSVPLRVEHQKDDNSIVGNVNKAWVDERNQLWIEALLDKSHPGASMLYKALKTGAKLGLSVGGRVKHAVREFSEMAGKMVKTFYNVVLDEVSVTSRPANYDAWLVSKSIINNESDGERYVDSPFYREFLFEKQSLDYMQSFAKSIPDSSWKKSDISKDNENKSMDKDKEKEEKNESEEKEKSADGGDKTKEPETQEPESETNKAFKSMVMKGFEDLTKMMAKLVKGADRGDSDEGTEDTTIMPEKKQKSADDDGKKDETETKEKTSDKEDKKDEETSEKNTEDYNLKAMKSILKKMEDLSKAMDDEDKKDETEKKEKAADDDGKKEDETTEKSLDSFVATLEKSVTELQEKFEKGGKRFPGLTEMIVNSIRNDTEVQKEIRSMMGEAGFKKSMQFGVPMMRTKDGKSYRLTAHTMEDEVNKSKKDNAGKTFKEVYNQNFSSSSSQEAGE